MALLVAALLPGCQIGAIVGGMVESYKQESTHEVKAEYTGLGGKDFAVVVSADRMIQAEQPDLVQYLTGKLTERLSANTNVPRPSGFVPAADVLRYIYAHPGWASRPMSDLAKDLGGVKRLVYVEMDEYRLHQPGNQYEWDGVASGTISVIEVDSALPDDFAFQRQINVKFPDKSGMGPKRGPPQRGDDRTGCAFCGPDDMADVRPPGKVLSRLLSRTAKPGTS